MQSVRYLTLLISSALVLGCSAGNEKAAPREQAKQPPTTAAPERPADLEGNLAKLSAEDRAAAQVQAFCAIQADHRLGSMGVPVKIAIKNKEGEMVNAFLCCKACEKAARKDEAKTAAVVEDLNIQGYLAKLSPADRKLAEAQKFCAAVNDSRLGSMGVPEKYIIKDKEGAEHPVFVCCGGCIKKIKKDESKTLQVVEEMKKKNAVKE